MDKLTLKNSYPIINLILAGVILVIFVYSAIPQAGRENLSISSQYKILTGKEANSSGLSRAFSQIIRFNFKEANQYNENSLEVFLFFLLQFIMRILFYFLYPLITKTKILIRSDIAVSVILFLICFKDLIVAMYTT
jgi:hypothetical protein